MREIKLEIWDKEKKEFVLRGDFLVIAGYLAGYHFRENGDISKYEYREWTGLLDKNGKEIYEGDIIQVGLTMYEIAWYTMGGMFQPFTTSKTNSPNFVASSGVPIRNWNWLGQGKSIYFQDSRESFEVEIIGNIYENPELLKS